MPIRVYFTSKPDVGNIKIDQREGRWFLTLGEGSTSVPGDVAGLVDEVSLHEWIQILAVREAGIYRYESAEAEVEPEILGGRRMYKVFIEKAKKLEDVLELFRRIKIGSIRPVVSYEGPQGGKSRAELEASLALHKLHLENAVVARKEIEAEVESMRGSNRVHEQIAGHAKTDLDSLKGDLSAYYQELFESNFSWPFCRKNKVMRRIRVILDNPDGHRA